MLLKTAIVNGNTAEIDGIIRCYGELQSKMNDNDAEEIYSFAGINTINYRRFISKLEAFRITCYYMDDTKFSSVWAELYSNIVQWIEDKNPVVVVGKHIFSAVKGSYLRVPQDQLIKIICECINKNMRMFYDDIFEIISNYVDLDQASPENVTEILTLIIGIVQNSDERKNIHKLEHALFALRKRHRGLTEELDKAISDNMPIYYEGIYRLETSDEENVHMPKFLEKYINWILHDNAEQGRNGTFFGNSIQPHKTVKNILQRREVKFPNDLIDSAFKASCETLQKETQTIEAKIDATELLVFLFKSQPNIQERNQNEIGRLLENRAQLETAISGMSNLSETSLKLSELLLYSCLGENIIVRLLEMLANIGDDKLSNRNASKAFLNYLEANDSIIADIQLEHIMLQQAVVWTTVTDLNTRWNAVQILFLLLRNSKNSDIVCNQLVKLMDTDNVYIKSKILRNIYLLKNIDFEAYKYILQKATVDTNYVVRKVVDDIQTE